MIEATTIVCLIVLLIIVIYQGVVIRSERKQHKEDMRNEINILVSFGMEKEKQWTTERQQLLDRIQAPTFSEYKHQEAKIIKAKSGVQDVVIEQL